MHQPRQEAFERIEAANDSLLLASRCLGIGVLPQALRATPRQRVCRAAEHRLQHDARDRAAQPVGADPADRLGNVDYRLVGACIRAVGHANHLGDQVRVAHHALSQRRGGLAFVTQAIQQLRNDRRRARQQRGPGIGGRQYGVQLR